jgi:plasmid stabilization system protein ParE
VRELVYRLEAASDVEGAFEWYERQRSGLGNEFLEELRSAERILQASPETFRVIRRDVRRYLLRRFPYQLLYRLVGNIVVVIGCFHVRRSPRSMAGRR